MWLLQVNNFEKERHCGKFFLISELFINCNKDNCCEYRTGGVNIYLYGCVSLQNLKKGAGIIGDFS